MCVCTSIIPGIAVKRVRSMTRALAGSASRGPMMRVIYLPLYWAGVPMLRTIIWLLSTLGILLVLSAAFAG